MSDPNWTIYIDFTQVGGFRYLCNRTLFHTGEKQTDVAVKLTNPLTHSYTIQPVVNMVDFYPLIMLEGGTATRGH